MTRSRRDSEPPFGLGPKDLRNAASPVAVERVWQRLEESTLGRRRARRGSFALWVATCSAATFGMGLWLGSGFSGGAANRTPSAEPSGLPAAEPEREISMLGTEAAGRLALSPRNVALPRKLGPLFHPTGPRRPLGERPEGVVAVEAQVNIPEASPGPWSSAELAESAAPPPWQRLANGGEYEAALFELGQTGGFEQAIGHSSAEQLMLLFDIARATGQHQRALAALRRIVAEYPSDPVAPLAAWSLGNLLEKVGDLEGARQAYATYRVLSPTGEFAEDALVRQIKNAVAAANGTLLARLVAQYESDFPEGRRHLEVARLATLRLGQNDGGTESSDTESDESGDSDESSHDQAEGAPPAP